MFIEAILISIIIGLIRGGKFRRFKAINHKSMWVLLLGILIQYILMFFNRAEEINSLSKILIYNREILIISYLLIFIGILTNIKFKSLWAILVGFIMNFLVALSNNWKRPILLEGIALTNLEGLKGIIEIGNSTIYIPIRESTKLSILGDIIIFPKLYLISRIISLGDLIISFGIFALIQEIMLGEDLFMRGYRL